MDDRPTLEGTLESLVGRARPEERSFPALVVAWSREEPDRIGEVVLVDEPMVLGRGGPRPEDGGARARLLRQRPGDTCATEPLMAARLSRQQLRLEPSPRGVTVTSLGKLAVEVDGETVERAEVAPGDVVRVERELVFYVTERPRALPAAPATSARFPFGAADPHGLVGESPRAWTLRQQLAFAARSDTHVLVHGESGTGKELAAAAIHALSSRARRPMVSRNAATLPEGLIDAELFGNVKNFPNPGMPDRPGLFGEANGSTLFLDEIGELPAALQAHLLRVLDAGGEYQRLGEAERRTTDVRLIAATNREIAQLKHDLAARLPVRIQLPRLDERREDVPLLCRHLVARTAQRLGAPIPEIDPRLVAALLAHRYTLHARELDQILWQAWSDAGGRALGLSAGVAALLAPAARAAAPGEAPAAEAPEPDREAITGALARAGGSVTRAARELGLSSRFVLYRLMKKHGIDGE